MTSAEPELPDVGEFFKMDPLDGLAVLSRYAQVLGRRFPPEYVEARRELARLARQKVDEDGKPYSLAQIADKIRRSKTLVWNLLTAGNPAHESAPPAAQPIETTVGGANSTVAVEAAS